MTVGAEDFASCLLPGSPLGTESNSHGASKE
jgi:hypothetical protein